MGQACRQRRGAGEADDEIELLAAGNCLLRKDEQDPAAKLDYTRSFAPD